MTNEEIVKEYEKQGFNDMQIEQIKCGLLNCVDITKFAKIEYSGEQMQEVLTGLLCGVDISVYAEKNFQPKQLRDIRLELQKGMKWKSLKDSFQSISNSNSYSEIFKALISFETAIEDEKILNDAFDFYTNSKTINSLITDEIIEYAENLKKEKNLDNNRDEKLESINWLKGLLNYDFIDIKCWVNDSETVLNDLFDKNKINCRLESAGLPLLEFPDINKYEIGTARSWDRKYLLDRERTLYIDRARREKNGNAYEIEECARDMYLDDMKGRLSNYVRSVDDYVREYIHKVTKEYGYDKAELELE